VPLDILQEILKSSEEMKEISEDIYKFTIILLTMIPSDFILMLEEQPTFRE
jgi:hypothetical protein